MIEVLRAVGTFRGIARAGTDAETLRRFRTAQLRRVVDHAYARVPYYRRLFDAHGVSPSDIREPDDLRRLPVTTRKTLQSLPDEDLLARGVDLRLLNTYTTSGSSGRVLTVRRTWVEDRVLGGLRLRAMRSYGLSRQDHVVTLLGAMSSRRPGRSRLQRLLARRGVRAAIVDCTAPIDDVVCEIVRLRPTVLSGYPGALLRVAAAADPRVLRALGIRFVYSGGEVLTPAMRERITAAFGAPLYDVYACFEFNLVAAQCPTTAAYHVCDAGLVLEVLDGDRPVEPGERGTVVGTCLHAYAMPFIRYELGDVVTRGEAGCACGARVSTLHEVTGRMIDFFPLPDGRVVHPYGVFLPLRQRSPWIRTFQVTQRRIDHFVMQVVASPPPTAEQVALVREMAAAGLGAGVRFDLEIVPDLAVETSGKFRVYRSLVHSEYECTPPERA
jgi:phenylacetate-CoA ligase